MSSTHPTAPQIVLTGLLAFAVAMGIGRFAFTPVLPLMLHEGWVDIQGGGWLATSNYLGYFIGALSCLVIRQVPTRMVKLGLILTIALTLLMGMTHLFFQTADISNTSSAHFSTEQWLWMSLRFGSGVASAWVFVFASGWGLHVLSEMGQARLGGLMYCGPGLGIMVSGLAIALLANLGLTASQAWELLAALAFILSLYIWRHLKQPATVKPTSNPATHEKATIVHKHAHSKRLLSEIVIVNFAYGLAGFGYIITATFLPVMAKQVLPNSHLTNYFWPIFGASIAIGAWQAGRISVAVDQRLLLIVSYLMQACGVWATLLWPNEWGFVLGCILLGLPYTALVLFAMREAARLAKLLDLMPSRMMGLMTALYGLGQIIGPPLATAWVKQAGSFTPSLLFAGSTLFLGAIIFAGLYRFFPYTKN